MVSLSDFRVSSSVSGVSVSCEVYRKNKQVVQKTSEEQIENYSNAFSNMKIEPEVKKPVAKPNQIIDTEKQIWTQMNPNYEPIQPQRVVDADRTTAELKQTDTRADMESNVDTSPIVNNDTTSVESSGNNSEPGIITGANNTDLLALFDSL